VQRELLFDSPNQINQSQTSTLNSRTSRSRQRSPENKYYKTIEKTVTTRDGSYPGNDIDTGLYGGINRRPDRTLSPPQSDKYSTNTTRKYNYSSTSATDDNAVPPNVPYNEIVHVETTQGGIPLPLKEVQLSEDILPKPSTKVTTTVRTYTYEIPAEPIEQQSPQNRTIVYKNESYDTSNTSTIVPPHHIIHQVPQSNPPTNQTIIYRNESHTTNTNVDYPGNNQPGYPSSPNNQQAAPYGIIYAPQQPTNQIPPQGVNKTIVYKKDTRETTTNVYPPNKNQYPIVEFPPEQTQSPPQNYKNRPQSPPVNNTTIIYKENITDTKNTNVHHPPPAGGVSVYPPTGNTPPQPGPKTTYYYKHESSNTTNTHYAPQGPGNNPPTNTNQSPYPNDTYPKSITLYPSNGNPPKSPPHDTTITYNYSTTTRNNNTTHHGYPHEKEPLLQPTPFPTDGYGPDASDGNPPKRLDDLMATFGDTSIPNYNNGPYVAEKPLTASNNQTALAVKPNATADNSKLSAKNIAGPSVYYPPGHELFAKKEESMAMSGYRSQGGYAKGSGKYMYESESKSKMKSSSGAAVVPVCLPLCCAMPCVIM
jgi:hypothetical protein